MSAPAERPWIGTIGNTTVCYRATREEAQAACDAAPLQGLVFVTHAASFEKWIRDPATKTWRPFKPTVRRLKDARAARHWWLD